MTDVEPVVVERCDLCGSPDTSDLFTVVDRLHRVPGVFAVVRCASCGLGRLSPRPTPSALARYYPDDYYAYRPDRGLPRYQRAIVSLLSPLRTALQGRAATRLGYPGTTGSLRWPRLSASLVYQRIAGYTWELPPCVPGGRALDVGCGAAHALADLAKLGWDVAGVDTSPAAADAAKALYGIDVHVGTLESAPFEPGTFDMIRMHHALEHVDQPMSTLRHCAALLRPGGWLYVELPNATSWPARELGTLWFGLDAPRHLWHFDPATLHAALGAAGLTPIRTWSYVMIRLGSWASTYRREADRGRALRHRPAVGPGTARIAIAARARRWRSPLEGDILCCWARKI